MIEKSQPRIQRCETLFKISFSAMASPCELLVETRDPGLVHQLSATAWREVQRIENKFSRYRADNLCHRINHAKGKKTPIDEECFRLLEFANECYKVSGGMFDLTSGVLRKLWKFDGGTGVPEQAAVLAVLADIGWEKVRYDKDAIQMPAGMEIDFGGIGKEYAVSRVAQICLALNSTVSVLVNFGGDIQITCKRSDKQPWRIGIEIPDRENETESAIAIASGALATSGDAKRFLVHEGVRYGHILNPKTGWPVTEAPRSVTVAADQCIQAGCLATMALLQGKNSEAFLRAQNVNFWCLR